MHVFALFRSLYGDSVLGASNLRMVEIARSLGSAVKFPGSGGAVIGLCQDPQQMVSQTRHAAAYILPHLHRAK